MGSIALIIRNTGLTTSKIAPWSFCLRIVYGIWIRPVARVSNKCMRYVIHSKRYGRHVPIYRVAWRTITLNWLIHHRASNATASELPRVPLNNISRSTDTSGRCLSGQELLWDDWAVWWVISRVAPWGVHRSHASCGSHHGPYSA